MPTQPYHTKDGKQVPGTTTIIGRRKEADGLIYWAWDLGKKGIDYRQARDGAANIGTVAHAMVEQHIKELPFDRSPYDAALLAKADEAFGAYLDWREQSRLTPVAVEVPLVSENLRFGGCLDMILTDGESLYVGDVKTSNRLNYDFLIQVCGAYKILWTENYPEMPIKGFHILRFSKDHPDFGHHYYRGHMADAERMFILMRQQYDLIAGLKKRAA